MKQVLCLGLLGCILVPSSAQSLETAFPLKWSAEVGNFSYRTQPAMVGNRLFVGSNGAHFMDYYHETGNGVYVLQAKTGQQIDVVGVDAWGDLDVNGVAAHNGRVYFGNDNDEFLCYNASSLELEWRLPTSGDVEHAPTVLQRKSGKVVVFATEQGEVRAVNPVTGTTVWAHYHKNFDGWKPGKTRFVYRVAAAMSNGSFYFSAPVLRDVDGDGVMDFHYSCSNGLVGISGQTGKVLYDIETNYNFRNQPFLLEHPDGPMLVHMDWDWRASVMTVKRTMIPSGKQLPDIQTGGYVHVPNIKACGPNDRLFCQQGPDLVAIHATSPVIETIVKDDPDISYHSIHYAQETVLWDGTPAVFEIIESDPSGKRGLLRVRQADSWKLLDSFTLPDVTESIPHLIDVDQDGRKELLFGCRDGRLYCHEIPQP